MSMLTDIASPCPMCQKWGASAAWPTPHEDHAWILDAIMHWRSPEWKAWKYQPREKRLQQRFHRKNE